MVVWELVGLVPRRLRCMGLKLMEVWVCLPEVRLANSVGIDNASRVMRWAHHGVDLGLKLYIAMTVSPLRLHPAHLDHLVHLQSVVGHGEVRLVEEHNLVGWVLIL